MIAAAVSASVMAAGVLLAPVPGGVAVTVAGKPFTTYHYAKPDGSLLRRPYCYPVLADDGTPVTDDQTLTGGDHPHHRSLWVGLGDVNRIDHWGTNDATPGGTYQRPQGLPVLQGNRLLHRILWDCGDGEVMQERRTLIFLAYPDGARAVDIASVFTAPKAIAVRLGDTKEAGLVAVRVAASMSASPVITAGSGCTGEPGCWGKAAAWCDCSGPVGGRAYGIAVLAAPGNPLFPPRWHVRAYGLLASNPFGLSAFDHAPPGTGDFVISAGTSAVFRHRIVVHRGSAADAGIPTKAAAYSAATDLGRHP